MDPGRETAVLQRRERATLLQRLRHHAEELELQPALAIQPPLLRASRPRRPAGVPAEEIGHRRARRRPGRHAEVPLLLPRPLLLLGILPALGKQHASLHAGAGATGRRALPKPFATLRPERQKSRGQATEAGGGSGATALAGSRQDDPGKRRRCRPCEGPSSEAMLFSCFAKIPLASSRGGSAADRMRRVLRGRATFCPSGKPLPLQMDLFNKFPQFCSALGFARRVHRAVVSSWHAFQAGIR